MCSFIEFVQIGTASACHHIYCCFAFSITVVIGINESSHQKSVGCPIIEHR